MVGSRSRCKITVALPDTEGVIPMNCHEGRKGGLKALIRKIVVFTAVCMSLCAVSLAVDATVIDASTLNIRSETNTDCEIVTKVKEGTTLDVTGKLGDWYSVTYGEHTGFVSGEYLAFANGVTVNNSLGTVTGSSVNVRSGPSTSDLVVTKLLRSTVVNVLAVENGWYKISYENYEGYISGEYLSVNGLVYTYVTESEAVLTLRQQLINYAKQFLGVKYVYGGSTPESGFDCSGFTSYVFKHFGYSLNRSSAGQASNGTKITKAELRPGDIVLFSRGSASVGHVGIYIGEGEFIHAVSPGKDVAISSLSESYYTSHYAGSRRIIED